MDITISLDTVFILLATLVFFFVWDSESKTRKTIHELRMEHREKQAEFRSENRKLRNEMSQIHRELKSAERHIDRLVNMGQLQRN